MATGRACIHNCVMLSTPCISDIKPYTCILHVEFGNVQTLGLRREMVRQRFARFTVNINVCI